MLSDRGNYGLLCCQNARQLHDEILCYLDNQKLKRQYDIHRPPPPPPIHTPFQLTPSLTRRVIIFKRQSKTDGERERERRRQKEWNSNKWDFSMFWCTITVFIKCCICLEWRAENGLNFPLHWKTIWNNCSFNLVNYAIEDCLMKELHKPIYFDCSHVFNIRTFFLPKERLLSQAVQLK